MKKSKTMLTAGVALAVAFVLAALLFTLPQYSFKLLPFEKTYGGFVVAFGEENYEGYLLFFLSFFLALIAVAIAVIVILKALGKAKSLKVSDRILFCVCAAFALFSAIIYLATHSHVMDLHGQGGLIDLSKNVSWMFAFWGAFALYIVALCVSVYSAVIAGKK